VPPTPAPPAPSPTPDPAPGPAPVPFDPIAAGLKAVSTWIEDKLKNHPFAEMVATRFLTDLQTDLPGFEAALIRAALVLIPKI
jgi:hypothetical protein